MYRKLPFILCLIIASPVFVYGQRISFRSLVMHRHEPRLYINNVYLPDKDSSKTELVVSFKVEYDDLTFLKQNPLTSSGTANNNSFLAKIQANLDIYRVNPGAMEAFRKWHEAAGSREMNHRRGGHHRRPPDRGKMHDLSRDIAGKSTIVARGSWTGSVTAKTYEETQSDKSYLQGFITTGLPPGDYFYQLRLSQPDEGQESRDFWRRARVPDLASDSTTTLVFLETTDAIKVPGRVPLINLGNNAFFGKNFTLFFQIPHYDAHHHYAVNVTELGEDREDTTARKSVFEGDISENQVYRGISVTPVTDTAHVYLQLAHANVPYTYAALQIPNSTFENALYRIDITDKTAHRKLGRQVYQSRWVDMPTSLYNLDVAIDMLQFMIPKSEIKKQFKGTDKEREDKFRAFWKKRDPTPKTAYNQLMAEYYRRIDYAFTHFSSLHTPGYEEDLGKTYIKYGPPDSVERRFPTEGPSVVIWHYGNHTFTFEATSGFGDYKLVKSQ